MLDKLPTDNQAKFWCAVGLITAVSMALAPLYLAQVVNERSHRSREMQPRERSQAAKDLAAAAVPSLDPTVRDKLLAEYDARLSLLNQAVVAENEEISKLEGVRWVR